jgi:hypothetical protein
VAQRAFWRFWFIVPLGLLLTSQLKGETSVLEIGFIVVFCLIVLLYATGLRRSAAGIFYIALLYSAGVLLIEYLYQFDQFSNENASASKYAASFGLTLYDAEDQKSRFWYLLWPAMIFFACIIQIRHASGRNTASVRSTASRGAVVHGIALVTTIVHRFVWLNGAAVSIVFVFAACIYPRPDLAGVVTIVLMFLASAFPNRTTFRSLLLLWIQLVLVAKLFYQIPLADFTNETETLSWLGGTKVNTETEGKGAIARYVQYYLYAILAVACAGAAKLEAGENFWQGARRHGRKGVFDGIEQRWPFVGPYTVALEWIGGTFHFHGAQFCAIVLAVVAFVRLNVFGAVYLLLAVLFPMVSAVSATETNVRRLIRFTRVSTMLVGLLLVVQYVSAVGLPPSVSYPYASWSSQNTAVRGLLRWLYVPPVDRNTNGINITDIVFANGPGSWSDPSALFADLIAFIFLLNHQRQLVQRRHELRNRGQQGDRQGKVDGLLLVMSLCGLVNFNLM